MTTFDDAKRRFVAAWWAILWSTVRSVTWVPILLLGLLSFLLLRLAAVATLPFLGVSPVVWLGVGGSVLASFVFLLLQTLIGAVRKAEPSLYESTYAELVTRQGLESVFSQRGSPEVVEQYSTLLPKARRRIWAFGMTNKHFVRQHAEGLLESVLSYQIDVTVAFWDPEMAVTLPGAPPFTCSALALQTRLEGGAGDPSPVVRQSQIDLLQRLAGRLPEGAKPRGTLRVVGVSSTTHFSALLIDDDLFFFPFLALADSTNDPMIHCSASRGFGKAVAAHLSRILDTTVVARAILLAPQVTPGPSAQVIGDPSSPLAVDPA